MLSTQSYPPFPGGSNVAIPQNELDDTEARLIQDGLVDYPGLLRERGPVNGVNGIVALSKPGSGIAVTLNPLGSDRYGVLNGDNANGFFSVYSQDFSSKVDLTWPHPLPTNPAGGAATAYRIVDIKPGLTGGCFIGVSSAYDSNLPNQELAYWRGGINANTSGTGSVARGSSALTGTGFLTNLSPGMWVFANTDEGYTAAFVGCVLQVNSDVSATLTAVSPYAVTAKTVSFQALRGIYPQITSGQITCDTTSPTVNGGATKFVDQGLNSGIWQLYRQNDMAFIGKITSVASNTQLTLTANAALALADANYVALRADADYSIITTANTNKMGFLNAAYTDRQWYANLGAQYAKTARLWFSDLTNPEALDVTNDGNWLDILSTAMVNEPIKAIIPAYNSLLVLKETESFAVGGNSPSSFSVKKVHDDGVLSGMSVQPYGGGAIWAGREGIFYFDGLQVTSLTVDKLGDVWKNSVRSFDPSKYRMWSMLTRDHYYLFIENLAPTVAIVKGNVSTTPNSWGVCINMNTRAITFMTNLHIRGAITLPAASLHATWYIVNDATKGIICDASDLFDKEGLDTIACDGGTTGPDLFVESKKFDEGDPLLLKRYKQLAVHYLAQGGGMKVDTILGLNNVGTTLSTIFPASVYTWDTLRNTVSTWGNLKNQFATWNDVVSSVFIPKRARFIKRNQFFSFRLYRENTTMTRLRIGPYQLGFKPMRPGRV